MTFVWWIPPQFWRAAFEKEGQMNPRTIDGFLTLVHPYTILPVADANMGPVAALNHVDGNTLRKSAPAGVDKPAATETL